MIDQAIALSDRSRTKLPQKVPAKGAAVLVADKLWCGPQTASAPAILTGKRKQHRQLWVEVSTPNGTICLWVRAVDVTFAGRPFCESDFTWSDQTCTYIVETNAVALEIVAKLLEQASWFEVAPLSPGRYEFKVKAEPGVVALFTGCHSI